MLHPLNELPGLSRKAVQRIKPYIWTTSVEYSPLLSRLTGARVWLKNESLQRTGSFKIRGAANFILDLSRELQQRGLVTASTGNHALAFATIVDELKLPGKIYLPETASQEKIARLREFEVELVQIGDDCLHAEIAAIAEAVKAGATYVSPYNHPEIIAGQGTIGLELIEQLPDVTAVFCPVGGGGLCSGVGAVMKEWKTECSLIGCQPVNSKVMHDSIEAGEILDIPSEPTLSDGTAGGMEAKAITFEYCQQLIDSFCLITEDQIKQAIRMIAKEHQLLIEGSAALSVAGALQMAGRLDNRTVVLILTGRHISYDSLRQILNEH